MESTFREFTSSPVAMDWVAEGDEFVQLLVVAARDVGITGHVVSSSDGTEDGLPAYVEIGLTEPAVSVHLCLVPGSNEELTILAKIPTVDVDPDTLQRDIALLHQVLSAATERLRRTREAFAWSAVIGVTQDLHTDQRLPSPAMVAGLELIPDSEIRIHSIESFTPNFGGGQVFHTYPVIVRGEDEGRTFTSAQVTAVRRLDILTCVLSVAWDACWQLKMGPLETKLSPGGLPPGDYREIASSDTDWGHSDVEIPEWLASAIALLDNDPLLLQAIRAFHQGQMLEARHPSFAVIAYVGVIEGIGARYVDLARCDCCETCEMSSGAGKRFRTALKHAVSKKEAKALSDIYDRRSKTAHEGRLHGHENQFGLFPGLSFFSGEASAVFRFLELPPLRRACRELLLKALTGDLPAPTAASLTQPET